MLRNRTWPESAFLVLTKRKAGSGDEIGTLSSRAWVQTLYRAHKGTLSNWTTALAT